MHKHFLLALVLISQVQLTMMGQTRPAATQLMGPVGGTGAYIVMLIGPGPERSVTFATLGPNITVVPTPGGGFPILDAVVPTPQPTPLPQPRTFGVVLLPVPPPFGSATQAFDFPEDIVVESETIYRNGVRQTRTVDYNIVVRRATFIPWYDGSTPPSLVVADYQKGPAPIAWNNTVPIRVDELKRLSAGVVEVGK